jgi:hypothetical protein
MGAMPDLRDAIEGRVDRWRWTPGLDPATLADALGTEVAPGPILYAGILRQAGTLQVPGAPWPVWAAWDAAGELLVIEVLEPPAAPRAAEVIAAFGGPEARIGRGGGPHPSTEQLAYPSRGFTLFAWLEAAPAALWLYRPMDFDQYVVELGATIHPTRQRR